MSKAPTSYLQMKQFTNRRSVVTFLLLSIVFILSSWGCFLDMPKNIKTHKNSSLILDNSLVLDVHVQDSKKILRVSFNANEGSEGELKIYDSSNQMVSESNFELIKSPFYASVDITNLTAGNYVVKLTTNVGVHQSSLVLQ